MIIRRVCYNMREIETHAVDGCSSREEVMFMYITLAELLALGVFIIELITLILRIKQK